MGAGIAAITTFVLGVGQRLAASSLMSLAGRIDLSRWRALSGYRRRLLARMEEMPFLYKDMRLSARDDYVEPQVATVTDSLNRARGNPDLDFRKPFMRFQESRRAMLFGEGGYGKTTLFRHITIRTLLQTRKRPVLDGPRLVPLFVALKTVRTSSDFPILDAMRRCDPYFEGAVGLKRLQRLAKSKRLLVFLDGYDEMPHAGGMTHVQEELETIFGRFNSYAPTFFEAGEHGRLYQNMQACRVYVSSRREFFFYSPFDMDQEVQKWVVRGLEDRRIELVDKIFDGYRESGPSSVGLDLDAELFMQELKRTADPELVQLSKSPLFLTVMCFVYVAGIRRNGRSTVFQRGAFDIISECIVLLISELDAAKAKGLTGAQMLALANRRSAFPKEKLEFLRFLATQLYSRSVGLFDRGFLNEEAVRYFRGRGSSGECDEILRGLTSGDATVNVVEQIILSGIFVLVDRHSGTDYFDFPHRRFRETLAVAHYNDSDGCRELRRRLADPAYGELILVYVEQSSHGSDLIRAMVERMVNSSSPEVVALFASALMKRPDSEAQAWVSELFECVRAHAIPSLPIVLLQHVSMEPDFVRLTEERLKLAIQSGDDRMLALWIEVLGACGPTEAMPLFATFGGSLTQSQLRVVIFSSVRNLSGDGLKVAEEYLRVSNAQGAYLEALLDLQGCFYVGSSDSDRRQFKTFLTRMTQKLSQEADPGTVRLRGALGEAMTLLADGGELIVDPERMRAAPWSPWIR